MLRTLVGLGSAMMLFGVVAFADNAQETVAPSEGTVVEGQAAPTEGIVVDGQPGTAAHDLHWHFITCVRDNHECYHEAQHHGYHHYRARHDHQRCHGKKHYACWGAHH